MTYLECQANYLIRQRVCKVICRTIASSVIHIASEAIGSASVFQLL